VVVHIEGREIAEGAVIPRAALHQGDIVWVVSEDSRLQFRQVEVGRIQGDEVLVTGGLDDGERLVITPLKAVTDGMTVRLVGEGAEAVREPPVVSSKR